MSSLAAPAPVPGLTFHHVGLACRDVAVEAAAHALLGFTQEGQVFEDPHQRVRGSFQTLGAFRVELLEPLDEESPLWDWLRRGVKLYHVCYETDDLAGAQHRESDRASAERDRRSGRGHRPVTGGVQPGQRTRGLVELLQR